MWVINVLSTDSRRPTVDKTDATSGSSASVCDRVPATRITKSSAYVALLHEPGSGETGRHASGSEMS